MGAYGIYFDTLKLPVSPGKIEVTRGGNYAAVITSGGTEVLLSSTATNGLRRYKFTAELPRVKRAYASYSGAFVPPKYFLEKFQKLREKPFTFGIVRDGGDCEFVDVVMEKCDTVEDAARLGNDISVRFSLVEHRRGEVSRALSFKKRENAAEQNKGAVHKVVKGDCLYNIALKYLGDGSKFMEVYQKNQAVIDAANAGKNLPFHTIYPGQELVI